MAMLVVNTAMCKCSMGGAPAPLKVLPMNRVIAANMPAANIMDHVPMLNVGPFGMCMSMANPMVASATAAATAAALGVFTFVPMPCIPVTPAPWIIGSPTVFVGTFPALNNTSTLPCIWAGVISILTPGEFTVMTP